MATQLIQSQRSEQLTYPLDPNTVNVVQAMVAMTALPLMGVIASQAQEISHQMAKQSSFSDTQDVGDPRSWPLNVDGGNELVATYQEELLSQLSYMALVFEMLKLAIKNEEQEKIFREVQRTMYILHMERVASNFKDQGNFLLVSNVIGGVLEILSGALPIFGHNARFGTPLFEKLKGWMGLEGIQKLKFYGNISKMLHGAAELGKASGNVQQTFAKQTEEQDRYKGHIAQTDENENTRVVEEINRRRDEIYRLALNLIQMLAETARVLNGG